MKSIRNTQFKKWLVSIGILVIAIFITKTDVKASNWYDSILNSTSGTFKVKDTTGKNVTAYRKNYPYYKAIDINGDGVKELFLSTTTSSSYTYRDSIVILSYSNKKVKPLLYINSAGGGHVSYKNKYICHYHRIADIDWYDIYQLKNGTLKSVVKLRREHGFFGSGANSSYQEIFYKNNVKCSKSTYNNYIKKYYTGGKKLTFSVIQTSVYKKVIKLLVNRKWYPARGSLANIYNTFTSTEYRTYDKKTKKLLGANKILSIIQYGNEYRLTIENGQQYRFKISNGKIEHMDCYGYSAGKWYYYGGNVLTRVDSFPNGFTY